VLKKINEGAQFGILDILAATVISETITTENWYDYKPKIHRVATMISFTVSEVLMLSLDDLHLMEEEWPVEAKEIYGNAKKNLEHILTNRMEAYAMFIEENSNQTGFSQNKL
jgi:hypothetical protein